MRELSSCDWTRCGPWTARGPSRMRSAGLVALSRCTQRLRDLAVKVVRQRDAGVLALMLAVFVGLQFFLPLRTALKIGADEDYELSKATLCNHGFKLYTQIWNDQPPLVTFIIANVLKHVSHSVLWPRLLTVGFAIVLLTGFFVLVRALSGSLAAGLATAMLIG